MTTTTASRPSVKGSPSHEKKVLNALLIDVAQGDTDHAVRIMRSRRSGLTEGEVRTRLKRYGKNEVAHERPPAWYVQLAKGSTTRSLSFLFFLGACRLSRHPYASS
jgi:Mg2+-importing ATPase